MKIYDMTSINPPEKIDVIVLLSSPPLPLPPPPSPMFRLNYGDLIVLVESFSKSLHENLPAVRAKQVDR